MPIFKFFLDSATDLYAMLRRYGNVTTVEERMHILPEKNPVVYYMRPFVGIRPYMRRIQNVQNGRARECTTPFIRIRDQHAKGPLTEPWQYELRRTKAWPHLRNFRWKSIRALVEFQTILNLLPNG